MARLLMRLWVWVAPFVALPLAAWGWQALAGDARLTAYALILPLVYGYVVPGVATGVYGWWRFDGARVGGVLWHHGFLWAGNMAPLLLAAFLAADGAPRAAGAVLGVVLASAALHGFALWAHDLGLASTGMVAIRNPPARAGRDPATVVAFYAPWCFPLIGAGYAVATIVAQRALPAGGWSAFAWLLPLGLLLLWLPATAVWIWRHGGIRPPPEG